MPDITELIHKYLRHDKKFPHVWCPGCGNGIVLGALIRAVDHAGLGKDELVLVSGIGCAGRMPVYADFNTLHTTHGRALTFATGIKLTNPGLKVIVVMGDGDALAIGGNHFIHAARRNIDLTCIIINNHIYGMTGGQASPATPYGMRSSGTPYPHLEHAFNISELAITAGAVFVARATPYHAHMLHDLMEKAIRKKGFGVVEILAQCPTYYGRKNQLGSGVEMMLDQKKRAVPIQRARDMSPEELKDKFTIGVLADQDLPVYIEEYDKIREAAREAVEKRTAKGPRKPHRLPVSWEENRWEIRMAGTGGQGILLAGNILAHALTFDSPFYVAQTQSYGAEARGGPSRTDLVISNQPLDFPQARNLDLLVALTREACEAHLADLKPGGRLMVDSALMKDLPPVRCLALPFQDLAKKATGRDRAANMAVLGALSQSLDFLPSGILEKAVLELSPVGTGKESLKAFRAGQKAFRPFEDPFVMPEL
jgi:2-oxoglutarate ferredoxin oxidoreductase subunit beta